MTAVIFCFSGTGNTWWCARRIAASLDALGMPTRVESIERTDADAAARLVAGADLVGLGWPVYGSDLPEPMKQFVDTTLPLAEGRRVFTFCTQLLFSGDGARVYERELAGRGWFTGWSVHLRMPNNISVTVSPLTWSADPDAHARRLEKTARKIDRFAGAVVDGRPFGQGRGWFSAVLGAMQRRPFRRWFPRLRNDITIDAEICTRCGRCVRICPSGNLTMTPDGVAAGGTCVLCVRCYNYCPVQAVLYMRRPHRPERGLPYRGPVAGFRPEELTADR